MNNESLNSTECVFIVQVSNNHSVLVERPIGAQRRFKSKNPSNPTETSRRINIMIISISTFHILGNVPYCLNSIVGAFTKTNATVTTVSLLLIYLSHSLSIFVFLIANKNYRKSLGEFRFWKREENDDRRQRRVSQVIT